MDEDDKVQCCAYLIVGFIVIYILYLFWQLIVFSIVIVVIIYCIYRVVTTWEMKFMRDSSQDYTYTPPKQSYKIEDEETPRKVSRTYVDHRGYRRYSDSDRLEHIHIAETFVVRRKLREDEVVHHINGNKLDNRAENLRVMTWDEHKRLHDR